MTIDDVRYECDLALQKLEPLFKPHCRLTLLMRNPHSNDGDLLITRDNIDEIIASVVHLKSKQPESPENLLS